MIVKSHFYNVIRKPQVWLPFLFLLIVLIGTLAYFSLKQFGTPELPGSIKYENDYLGFSMLLTKDFEPYHTQRKESQNYTDIEVFVPTADRTYAQEIASYAKVIVVRIYDRETWDGLAADSLEKSQYEYQGVKGNKVYTIKFWELPPSDWTSKWNDDTEKFITGGFKIL